MNGVVEFVDTHCHIHEAGTDTAGDEFVREKWAAKGITDPKPLIHEAAQAGVTRLICVGCTLKDSQMALKLAGEQENCWASIGIHPHEAKDHLRPQIQQEFAQLVLDHAQPSHVDTGDDFSVSSGGKRTNSTLHEQRSRKSSSSATSTSTTSGFATGQVGAMRKVVAIGEIGLDYYYTHSTKQDQLKVLEFQLELAQKHHLPLILHIREAFTDFWPVFDQFKGLKGVVHSFSAELPELEQILARELYVGLNGIMTFTKSDKQLAAAKAVPRDRLLLETDAPFLTPVPKRGTICQPKHLVHTAEFLAGLRGESVAEIADATTQNACNLFSIK